jgi:Ca2+/H+ antiporter
VHVLGTQTRNVDFAAPLGRGHTKESGNRNAIAISVTCNLCSSQADNSSGKIQSFWLLHHRQDYWIFRELLSTWLEHMLHDMEVAVASFLGVLSALLVGNMAAVTSRKQYSQYCCYIFADATNIIRQV